mgnify:CR=1 FL=1
MSTLVTDSGEHSIVKPDWEAAETVDAKRALFGDFASKLTGLGLVSGKLSNKRLKLLAGKGGKVRKRGHR